MIKAVRKKGANAEPARAFADIFRTPTHEEEATQRRSMRLRRGGIPNGWSDASARDALSSAGFNHIKKLKQ